MFDLRRRRCAYVLSRKGALDSSVADYGEAIRLNPTNPVALQNRGIIFRTKGDIDRAIADYRAAIKIDPGYVGALTNRGLAYEAKNDLEHARADFHAALALPPRYGISNGPTIPRKAVWRC